jgi:transcriptional regulator with XRE-family HTH domain
LEGGVKTESITKLREQAGLSKAELGRRVGVTGPAVKAWEDPGRHPDAEKLPAIADALGVSIDALYGRDCPAQS